MLDKQKILEAALEGVKSYITNYNFLNDAMVVVSLGDPEESDHGVINIDGGHRHGAWSLLLGEM